MRRARPCHVRSPPPLSAIGRTRDPLFGILLPSPLPSMPLLLGFLLVRLYEQSLYELFVRVAEGRQVALRDEGAYRVGQPKQAGPLGGKDRGQCARQPSIALFFLCSISDRSWIRPNSVVQTSAPSALHKSTVRLRSGAPYVARHPQAAVAGVHHRAHPGIAPPFRKELGNPDLLARMCDHGMS